MTGPWQSDSDPLLRDTAAVLKVRPEDVPTKVSALLEEIAALSADIGTARALLSPKDTP